MIDGQHITDGDETYRIAQYQLGWNDAARAVQRPDQSISYYIGRADYFSGRPARTRIGHANA